MGDDLLGGLLGSGLLLSSADLEGSRSSLTLGLDNGLLLNQRLQSLLDEGGKLDSVDLVVGGNVLLDGWEGRSVPLLEGLDGSDNHDGSLGVSWLSLGLGSLLGGGLGGVGHDVFGTEFGTKLGSRSASAVSFIYEQTRVHAVILEPAIRISDSKVASIKWSIASFVLHSDKFLLHKSYSSCNF